MRLDLLADVLNEDAREMNLHTVPPQQLSELFERAMNVANQAAEM
jgi:hypothetical protein